MEHDPQVVRICAISYLEDIKKHRSKLTWSRERVTKAQEDMDGIKTTNLGYGPALRTEYDKMFAAYDRRQKAIADCLQQMAESMELVADSKRVCDPDHDPSQACWLHYVEDKPWKEIAERMGYDVDYLRDDVRERGLARIYKRMPEEYRRAPIPNAAVADGTTAGAC